MVLLMETNCELVVKGWIGFLVNITEIRIAYVVNRTKLRSNRVIGICVFRPNERDLASFIVILHVLRSYFFV
jgi:hypothetical protein